MIMSTIKLKTSLHTSIECIEDIHILEKLKDIVDIIVKNDDIDFWNELTDDERKEVNLSLLESKVDENLIPHEQVMKQAKKWLTK